MKKIIVFSLLAAACQQVSAQQQSDRQYSREGLSARDIERREAYLASDEYKKSKEVVNAVPLTIPSQKPAEVPTVAEAVSQAVTPVQGYASPSESRLKEAVNVSNPQTLQQPAAVKSAQKETSPAVQTAAPQQAKVQSGPDGPAVSHNAKLSYPAPPARDAAKEAEIRDRIKAATTNGQGSRR